MNNETFLRLLLKNGNSHLELKTDTKFFKNLITFITDIDFKKPNTLLEVDSSYLEPQTSSDDDIDMNRIAYTKDNLYDIVSDAIGYFQLKITEPIPFNKNDAIKR